MTNKQPEKEEEKKFVNLGQELQFYCSEYWKMLWIKNLYQIYKSNVWKIERGNDVPKDLIEARILKFKAGITQLEQWYDKYEVLLGLFIKITK